MESLEGLGEDGPNDEKSGDPWIWKFSSLSHVLVTHCMLGLRCIDCFGNKRSRWKWRDAGRFSGGQSGKGLYVCLRYLTEWSCAAVLRHRDD
jgi:hypothetical protein